MTYFRSLSAAGFAATAISFGPARMGFGLFVPQLRESFSMSTQMVGIVASLGFLGFLIGLLAAQALLVRRGPRAPVLAGLGAATAGLGLVPVAPNVPVLAAGVFLAASSAGFAWTPFNDAVHRKIRDVDRPRALSEISTGTSVGVAGAGLLALAAVHSDIGWRLCWAAVALFAAAAFVTNFAALRHVERAPDAVPERVWRQFLDATAAPLFAVAFVFGAVNAIFISFAPEHFSVAGGAGPVRAAAIPALVFVIYGLCGLSGLLTQQLRDRLGLPLLLRLLMLTTALSAGLAGLLPGHWAGLAASAGLQGIFVMVTSAVLAFWSERLFPSLPSFSFTAALVASAAGGVAGPALAGVVSTHFGAQAMFLAVAALPLVTALALGPRNIRERPSQATLAWQRDATLPVRRDRQ